MEACRGRDNETVSGFSEDGQWWWDGQKWVVTEQVLIPDLGLPGASDAVQRTAKRYQRYNDSFSLANSVSVSPAPEIAKVAAAGGFAAYVFLHRRMYRAFRQLKLAQLAQAATYLLGPGESILAAEAGIYPWLPLGRVSGLLAVVLSEAHMLILASEEPLEPPRRVAMAAHPGEVQIEQKGRGRFDLFPTLLVRRGGRLWSVKGWRAVFQPEPVLAAYRTYWSGSKRNTE